MLQIIYLLGGGRANTPLSFNVILSVGDQLFPPAQVTVFMINSRDEMDGQFEDQGS